MTCEKCSICGLVLENHDFDMAMKCVSLSGTTINEICMNHLRCMIGVMKNG